jgi:hypothetical protein
LGIANVSPTPQGEEIAQRLIAARQERLSRLCEGWPAERHGDLATFIARLARELAAEPAEHAVPVGA